MSGALMAEWAPAVVAVVAWIFIAGQVSGRIKGQEKTIARHDDQLLAHDSRLNKHDIEITEGRAWRDGYNAGRSKT